MFIIGLHIKWIPRATFYSISQPFGLSTINVRAVKVFSKATTPKTSDEVAMATRTLTRNPKRTSAVRKPEVSGDVRSTSNGIEPPASHPTEMASSLTASIPSFLPHTSSPASLLPSSGNSLTIKSSHYSSTKTSAGMEDGGRGRLLCCTLMGRLGNEMYQYASVLGIAYRTSRIPVLLSGQHLRTSLKQPPPGDSQKDYVDRCRMSFNIVEKSCCFYDPRLVNLDADKDYKIGLYLQSWKYFRNYEDQIRQAMTFNADVTSAANETVSALRAKGRKFLVGVHVRRGDYLLKKHVEMGYKAASASYLRTALDYFRQRLESNVTFIVSSDDEYWFQTYVSDQNDTLLLNRQTPAIDMLVLASLDHVIITVGTYGWWVGFLNKGTVVHQKDYIAPNTKIGDQFGANGSDYIFPGWIPL